MIVTIPTNIPREYSTFSNMLGSGQVVWRGEDKDSAVSEGLLSHVTDQYARGIREEKPSQKVNILTKLTQKSSHWHKM